MSRLGKQTAELRLQHTDIAWGSINEVIVLYVSVCVCVSSVGSTLLASLLAFDCNHVFCNNGKRVVLANVYRIYCLVWYLQTLYRLHCVFHEVTDAVVSWNHIAVCTSVNYSPWSNPFNHFASWWVGVRVLACSLHLGNKTPPQPFSDKSYSSIVS